MADGRFSSIGRPRIPIAFRFDDCSGVSPDGPEAALFALFRERGIPLTVGVIPFAVKEDYRDPRPQPGVPLSPEKAGRLRAAAAAGAIEPAQHGYSHQSRRRKIGRGYTEFAGLSRVEQRSRIVRGRDALRTILGREIAVFIPPWNSSDAFTRECLLELGFLGMSSGFEDSAGPRTGLRILPWTAEITSLRSAVLRARREPRPPVAIVVLLHGYDIAEFGGRRARESLAGLGRLLTWIAAQPDLLPATLGEILKDPAYSFDLFRANRTFDRRRTLLLPRLRASFRLPVGLYLPAGRLAPLTARATLLLAGTALGAAGCGAGAGLLFKSLAGAWAWSALAAALAGLGALGVRILGEARLTYKTMPALGLGLGFVLGWLVP